MWPRPRRQLRPQGQADFHRRVEAIERGRAQAYRPGLTAVPDSSFRGRVTVHLDYRWIDGVRAEGYEVFTRFK